MQPPTCKRVGVWLKVILLAACGGIMVGAAGQGVRAQRRPSAAREPRQSQHSGRIAHCLTGGQRHDREHSLLG